jgi:hypothetical protein
VEIIGGLVVAACLWYAQSKPEKKKEEKKKPDITIEIYDHRKRVDTGRN